MNNPTNFPYYFNNDACDTCGGQCCRGFAGYVWVSMEELEKIAGEEKIDAALFSDQYIRQVEGRLSLQERVVNREHFCCFFDRFEGLCTIYQNRPRQCRTFPFWDQFMDDPQKLASLCPGVLIK